MRKFLSDVLIDCNLTVSGSSSLGAATGVTVDSSDNSANLATTAWVKSLGYVSTNTTYLLSVPANTTNITLQGSDSINDEITLSAAGASSISRVSASELRITSTNSIDYVNSVSLVGTDLTFASVGNGFAGAIDLSGITTSFNAEEVQTVYENIKNVSGSPIQKGTPLAVVQGQTSGNSSDVVPAAADDPARMPAVFIANEDLADQAEGLGVVYGNITGIDTSAYDSGVTVYVAPGGGWTAIKPDGDALIQNLGIITKVHPSNGAGVVMGAGRSNDVPNIPTGHAWVGNANGVATPTLLGSLAYSSATYDNYVSWNLKTNGVQRTTVQSGGNLDIVAGSNVSVAYGAGGVVTISSTDTNTDTNNYVTGLSFNTGNGILTATRQGLTDLTVDLDGRYLTSYTETDTLDSVADRGATTNQILTVGGLKSTGDVGIGTTNPLARLHVSGGDGDVALLLEADVNNANEAWNPLLHFKQDAGNINAYIGLNGEQDALWPGAPGNGMYINPDEELQIASSNVPIANFTTGQLEVLGNIKSTGYLIIGGDDAARIALGSGTGNPVPQEIASFGSSVHIGAFIDFTIYNQTKEHMRSGTLQLVFNADQVMFNEVSTMDIGDTTPCLLTAVNNAGVVSVLFETPDPTFYIKYQTRTI